MSTGVLATVPLIRWGTSAAMLLPVGVIVLLQAASDRWAKAAWLPVAGSLAMVVAMLVGGFQSADNRRGGPNWRVEIATSRPLGAAAPARSVGVQSYPPGWQVTVPCRLIT